MTIPLTGVTSPTGTTSTTGATSTSSAKKNDMLDPQAFLQLLVAQLQYQDPSSPTDTSQFLNQTAMLSQVQTMNAMSDSLTTLNSTQQLQAATNMIGKQITYLDASGTQKTGVVDTATLQGGSATLHVGGASVALDKVLQVTSATSATP